MVCICHLQVFFQRPGDGHPCLRAGKSELRVGSFCLIRKDLGPISGSWVSRIGADRGRNAWRPHLDCWSSPGTCPKHRLAFDRDPELSPRGPGRPLKPRTKCSRKSVFLLVMLQTLLDSWCVGNLMRNNSSLTFPDWRRSHKVQTNFGKIFELQDVCMNPTSDLLSLTCY